MKKIAMFAAAALLFTAVLCGGLPGLSGKALAAGSDAVTLADPFKALLVPELDKNGDGEISEDEMAGATSLTVSGDLIDDLTGIGYAVNLTSLTIEYTSITALPPEISNLTKLKSLRVDVNMNMSMDGLPAELWGMTQLETLELGMDKLGAVPAGVENLTGLKELNLYNNGITELPATIGNMTSLEKLYLQDNDISALPPEFWNLMNLKELTLWANPIGSISDDIGGLSHLEVLDLADTGLTQLPSTFANLTSLKTLKLNDNLLTELPAGVFDGMTALSTLYIENNYLDPSSGSADMDELYTALARASDSAYTPQYDYAVTLNYNGGSGSALPKARYYYGQTVTLPGATHASRVFTGWDINGDNQPEMQADDTAAIEPAVLTTESITFKAIYGYTVTFRTQAFGTIDGGKSDISYDVNAGERVSRVPIEAANDGYEFLGWSDGGTLMTADQILAADVVAGKTYTATFQAIGTIHFPDARFAAALMAAGVDENPHDGFITQAEMGVPTALTLSGGQFTDITGIKWATNLREFHLGTGQVTTLPEEVGSLATLQVLDLGGNPIASLPSGITGLTALRELDMDGCGLTALPTALAGMDWIRALDISNNRLAEYPSALGSSVQLTTLDLSGNLLTDLPVACFSVMPGLASLDLSDNYFNPASMPAATPAFATYAVQHTYAATLNCDNGTAAEPQGYYYGEQIDLPEASKDGYDFYGWDTNGDGTAEIVGAGSATLTPNPPDSITSWTYKAIYLSQNAHLSGITLTSGAYLSPTFDGLQQSYTVTLYDYVGNVTITPVKANAGATVLIDGVEKPSAAVSLASSSASADVTIDLTAEDKIHTYSYTLHVVRAATANLALTRIAPSSGVTMSPAFSSAVMSYTALVPASMSSVTITATRASSLSSVSIDGVDCPEFSRAVSVGMGAVKVVQIVVSDPLSTDKTKVYTLTLKRGTSISKFTAVPKVGTTYTLSPGGTNRMTFSYTMGGPGSVKTEVYKSGRWVAILSRSETAGAKTWAWDGRVSGVYLPVNTYKVRITPTANGIVGTALTISVKIVKYPTVTWRTVTTSFRATGALRVLCSFRVNYPTNAKVQVYNSRGKIAATVKSITNMLPSLAYTTVSWNGKATTGNTAGLRVGALVPAGTYTIRITTGTKVYIKTIKITK